MGLEKLRDAYVSYFVVITAECVECRTKVSVTLSEQQFDLWCDGTPERLLQLSAYQQRFLRTGKCKQCLTK